MCMVVIPVANIIASTINQDTTNENKISSYNIIQETLSTMKFPSNVKISFNQEDTNKKVDEKTVVIELVGMSAFLSFDSNVKTEEVIYESSDVNVVFPNEGRLLALGIGEAIVQVTYEGSSKSIRVIVEKEFDRVALRNYLSENKEVNSDPNNEERMKITAKARAMTYQAWRPTKDLVKWGPLNDTWEYFKKDTYYFGIPYTQVDMVDEISFLEKMSASNFYTPNTSISTGSGKKVCPQFGSDCSAFVSFSWNIARINTGEFRKRINNGTYKRLSSYSQLRSGDAVVNDGHMFLIANNFETPANGGESYVMCHEQTPPHANDTFYTYSVLSKYSYIPFSKFK